MKKLLIVFALFLITFPALANVKISDMPNGGQVEPGDAFPIVRDNANYKAFFPNVPTGGVGDVQTNAGGGLFGNFSINTTAGSGSSASGLLFNNNGVTQALSVGTVKGLTNTVTPIDLAAQGLYQITQGLIVDPRWFGAQCNASYNDGRNGSGVVTMTSGSNIISISGYTFTANDIGKSIAINGGDRSAGVNTGTILSVDTALNKATLDVTPNISTSSGYAVFGHNDTIAFQNASTAAVAHGGYVIVPDKCLVRGLGLAAKSTLKGGNTVNGYPYVEITPTLYILATGYTEDTVHYGINTSTANLWSLDGFEISGLTFFDNTNNGTLSCIGSKGGTPLAGSDSILLTNMTIEHCFVDFGYAVNESGQGGCMSGATRFNEFASAGYYGWNGCFNDFESTDDVWTGNFGEGLHLTGGTSLRIIGGRIEESPQTTGGYNTTQFGLGGINCNGCALNITGLEWQFQGRDNLYLQGGYNVNITGGSLEGGGVSNASGKRAQIGLAGTSALNSLSLSNVVFDKNNYAAGGQSQYIFDMVTSAANNPSVEINGGSVCRNGYSTALINTTTNYPTNYKIVTNDCPQTITGHTDYSINTSSALGLQTSNAKAGSILDMMNATTSNNSSVILPQGTTTNRPGTPQQGMTRLNTTTTAIEAYYNGQWNTLEDRTTGVTSVAPAAGISTTRLSGGAAAITATGSLFADAGYFYGTKGGLILSNDNNTPNTVIDISPGSAANDAGNVMMKLGTQYTKTTGSWAVGTGNGCLDAGSVAASTWYHVFLIERIDTGVVDILCSTSGTSPIFPTNYAFKRDIGVFQTDGSANILGMRWVGNNYYRTTGRALDYTSTIDSSASLITLSDVPPDANVTPICSYDVATDGACILFSSPQEKDEAPNCTYPMNTALGADALVLTTSMGVTNAACPYLTTNSTQQIRARSSISNTALALSIRGFIYSFFPSNFSLNFLTGALPSSVTFTRASSAKYYNSLGLLTTAATDVPRFDYNPSTLALNGLLVEQASTNLNSIPNASYGFSAVGMSVATNQTTSPDGTVDAVKWTEDFSNGVHRAYIGTGTVISGGKYTLSAYLKAGTATGAQLCPSNCTTAYADFDISLGTVASSGGTNLSSSGIQNVGNGWFRCWVVYTATSTFTDTQQVYFTNDNTVAGPNPTYVGTGQDMFLYGLQEEAGTFPTSPITGTRAVDSVSVSNPPLFSPIAGTFTTQAVLEGATPTRNVYTASYSDGTTANNISSFIKTTGQAQAGDVITSSAFISGAAAGSPTVGTSFTQTVKYIASNNKAYFNGSADTAGTFGAAALPIGITTLQLGDRVDHTLTLNGWLQTFSYAQ